MAIIGKFIECNDGSIRGFIHTLHGEIPNVQFVPSNGGADWDIITTAGCELGFGWDKTSAAGKDYISVRLVSPFLDKPIQGALFEARETPKNNEGQTYELVASRIADIKAKAS